MVFKPSHGRQREFELFVQEKMKLLVQHGIIAVHRTSMMSGVPPEEIFQYLIVAILLSTLAGISQNLTSNIVGIAYPLFKTMECLERESTNVEQLDL